MKRFLILAVFCVGCLVSFLDFPKGAMATVFSGLLCILTFMLIDRIFEKESAEFLNKVFLLALLLRVFAALTIYFMEWEPIFGPDAETFDTAGRVVVDYWTGGIAISPEAVERYTSLASPGWGMHYLVGIVYYLSGQNPLAVQFISCTLGAATVPAVFYCANRVFYNVRVAKYSALFIAFFPAMILWSSQMLKDGFIVFFLVLSMACIIQLHQKFDYLTILTLLFSLFALFSFRSYIFYMVTAALIGSFIVGAGKTSESIAKRMAVLVLLGTAVAYLGFRGGSSAEIGSNYGMERLQVYRQFQAEGTGSGFGEEYDVSTVEGTVTLLPVGMIYILFAPFPWQIPLDKEMLILPEMLIWWASLPFLIRGLLYTVRNRLRIAIPILTFSAMLTTAYALFQSNIGAAYRQRTQIQVFLFIFVAVGWTVFQENRENRDYRFRAKRKKVVSR